MNDNEQRYFLLTLSCTLYHCTLIHLHKYFQSKNEPKVFPPTSL